MVYFHNPHMFITDGQKENIRLVKSRKLEINLKHEEFNMLHYGGEICVNNITYDKDDCVHKELEKRAIEKYGCTTPYSMNKTQICKANLNGRKVLRMYQKAFFIYNHTCKNPCVFINLEAIVRQDSVQGYVNGKSAALMKIFIKENIKVIKGQYLYSALSLLAEIGGYVGLFLGVSVNQISWLIDAMFTKIEKLYRVK